MITETDPKSSTGEDIPNIVLSNSTVAENTTLYCLAVSDPSTPVTYRWTLNKTDVVTSPAVIINSNTLVINPNAVSEERRDALLGNDLLLSASKLLFP